MVGEKYDWIALIKNDKGMSYKFIKPSQTHIWTHK